MRAMWKGSISFGLVNIPSTPLCSNREKDLKFRYLHAPCHTPLEYQKVCSTCKTEVPGKKLFAVMNTKEGAL